MMLLAGSKEGKPRTRISLQFLFLKTCTSLSFEMKTLSNVEGDSAIDFGMMFCECVRVAVFNYLSRGDKNEE